MLVTPNRGLSLTVEDLYMAEVYVMSQDDAQLKSGAQAALLQVLIRVSGTQDVQDNRLVTNALRNPSDYYYQYSYQASDREFQIGGQQVPARILRLRFEPSAIGKLLRDADYPVWGSNRPSVLLWLAVSDEQGRRLISESDSSEVLSAVEVSAEQRGLPLLFPLLDLEDEAQLSTAEVWGSFLGRIDTASSRYKPDCVLTGRVRKSDTGQWTANWNYRIDNQWSSYSNIAYNADDLVAEIVNSLADSLARRYAIDSSRGTVEIRIDRVDNLADYAAVSKYLQSLAPVLDSYLVEVRDSQVLFQLSTEGQTRQLIEIIELDNKMLLLGTTDQMTKLQYQWLQ
ncbi:MAG: DUF2066 domain-containing protein [bacterium]